MASAVGLDVNISLVVIALIVLLYVLYGGLIGVIYTDALLASIMFLSSLLLLGTMFWKLGGITEAHIKLTEIATLIPDKLVEIGHTGWVSMPVFGSPIWWSVISTLVLGITIGTLAQPQLQVKLMAVKDVKNLYIGIAAAALFIWMLTGGSEIVGILSNVYFYNESGMIAITAAEGNVDMIIPKVVSSLMPEWFVYLFMFSLLAATLSSAASLLHLQGIAFAKDIFGTYSNDENMKRLSRIGTILGLVLSLVLAFILPPGIIARATVFWFGICAICWLPSYTGCLFWKGSTKEGAIASLFIGLFFTMFWYLFVKSSEAIPFGICRMLTGKDVLFGHPWSSMDPLVVGIPLSTFIFYIVSKMSKKPT